ncbi:MAG: hypothetical protein U1F68_08575 [Gammaproteobacteria bacterium]
MLISARAAPAANNAVRMRQQRLEAGMIFLGGCGEKLGLTLNIADARLRHYTDADRVHPTSTLRKPLESDIIRRILAAIAI